MNTDMARPTLVELSGQECQELLSGHSVGRIGFVEDGQPSILPVTYALLDDAVVFRTDEGSGLHALARDRPVAFEVDRLDRDTATAWSVLVRGIATEVADPEELRRAHRLPLTPWPGGRKDRYVKVVATTVSGRRVEAPATLAALWWG